MQGAMGQLTDQIACPAACRGQLAGGIAANLGRRPAAVRGSTAKMATATLLVGQAEEALVLGEWVKAEFCARDCLQQAAYLPHDAGGIQDRACIVLLQALYETQRFGSARKLLRDAFTSLEAAPPHTLLLWLSLALDTECRGEAQRLILSLLDTRQPGSDAGWSRRQYLALLHLYVFEVLLPEMREVAEVMRWVGETRLPVTAEERQVLLDELAELKRQQQAERPQARPAPAVGGGSGVDVDDDVADWQEMRADLASAGTGSPPDEQQQQRGYDDELDESCCFEDQQQQQQQQQRATTTQQQQQQQPREQKQWRPQQPSPEIEPVEIDAAAGGAPSFSAGEAAVAGLDWLGRWQRQALQAASAVFAPLLGLSQQHAQQAEQQHPPQQGGLQPAGAIRGQPGGGWAGAGPSQADPAASLQLLTGSVLGAVLLYAAYAERQAIHSGVARARRGVVGGITDLVRMAFSMSVNPMAAQR